MSTEDYVYFDVARSEMVAFIPASAQCVLDVGCGLGGFGKELKRQRPDVHVTGIEADAGAAAQARERYDEMVVGFFPDAVSDQTYDCIVFNDVLEHMVDPWAAVSACLDRLAPDGCVVASIPNLRYFTVLYRLVAERDFTYVSDGILDRTHLRFFTHRTARALLEASGLRVDVMQAINEVDPADLPARYRRILRTVGRVRPSLGTDLRAQQYAFVARPAVRRGTDPETPRVSVIMPTRNVGGFVREALDSVLNQTFTDLEVIVIDDGSSDDTVAQVKAVDDARVRLIAREVGTGDLGMTLNLALEAARGEYVARMDGDDISYPGRFMAQVGLLDAHPEIGLVGTLADVIDEHGKRDHTSLPPTTPGAVAFRLHYESTFHHPSVMFRRSLAQQVGGYAHGKAFAEDYDLWSRLAPLCGMANVDEVLFAQRVRSTSVSARFPEGQAQIADQVGTLMFTRTLGRAPSQATLRRLRTGVGDAASVAEASRFLVALRNQLVRDADTEQRTAISQEAAKALLQLVVTSPRRQRVAPFLGALRVRPGRTGRFLLGGLRRRLA